MFTIAAIIAITIFVLGVIFAGVTLYAIKKANEQFDKMQERISFPNIFDKR